MKRGLFIVFIILAFVAVLSIFPRAWAQDESLTETLRRLLSNPGTWLIFFIQGALGFGLGYFSMKALKYIIAIIAIIGCGILLNVWQFGGIEGFLGIVGIDYQGLLSIFNSLASIIGILTILPIGIGFFLGIVVATMK